MINRQMDWKVLLSIVALCWQTVTVAAQTDTTGGGVFVLDSASNCKIWNPKPVQDETVKWSGACVDGYASGGGTVEWFVKGLLQSEVAGFYKKGEVETPISFKFYDGDLTTDYVVKSIVAPDVYVGTIVEAKTGIVYARYEGGFKEGLRDGQGSTAFFENGVLSRRISGRYVNNELNGVAVTTFSNGASISANYREGVAEGSITSTFSNGDRRIGWAKANLLDGPAIYVVKLTNQQSDEIWSAGKKVFSTSDKKLALGPVTRFEVLGAREVIAFAGEHMAAKITTSPYCKPFKRDKPFRLKAFSENLSAWDTVVLDDKTCKIERIERGT